MIACQRWRNGRAHYRPAGEPFNPARAAVHAIDQTPAKAFTERHHYSGSYPATRFRAGLFVQGKFAREILAGVAIFSVPTHESIIPNHFGGLDPLAGVVLGRLVLLDEIPGNAESWFVARAFRLLRPQLGVDGVLSYSDPIQRVAADGNVVKRGHVGTVYQALNACYRGRTRARTMVLARDGREVQLRTLSKLRNDEVGAGYAYQQLRALGAPERRPFEGGAEYVNRALTEGGFRKERHPGNHTYTWWLGERRARPAWEPMPYPKAGA
jgi:hypothetical protein